MSRRPVHRWLLSLLMVWQLLASVLAHPLPAAMIDHVSIKHGAEPVSMAGMGDCPHRHAELMHASFSETDVDNQSNQRHSCHSVCKCPCAGTPALVFLLPALPAMLAAQPVTNVAFQSLPAAPVASLLRPPIV